MKDGFVFKVMEWVSEERHSVRNAATTSLTDLRQVASPLQQFLHASGDKKSSFLL